DLLDTEYRLSRARRIDEADERRRGRAVLQQHDPDGNLRGILGERALAKQSHAGREFSPRDLQRQYEYQLQLIGLQRLSTERRSGVRIRVELAAKGRRRRLQRSDRRRWAGERGVEHESRGAQVPNARGLQRRDPAGAPQRGG